MGVLTTPQLHWMVRARNKGLKASEQDYFEQLSSSFRLVRSNSNIVICRCNSFLFLSFVDIKIITEHILLGSLYDWIRCLMDLIPSSKSKLDGTNDKLVVDGANGVGGVKLKVLEKLLNDLVIEVRNCGEDGGVLNDGVGADYVQKEKIVPHGFGSKEAGIRLVCSSSDAERKVGISMLLEFLYQYQVYICIPGIFY